MKISIITVTYNSIKYIKDCLASVKSQSYLDIEHIIVDGASNDGTLSLIESKRKQFATIITEPDKGVYHAMNKGIKVAKGDIVGFLNSDDFYTNNNVISEVVKEFKKDSSIDACYADLIYVGKYDTSKVIRYVKSCEFKEGLFSKGWCPPHPTFFVRRSVYRDLGNFDINYNIASDVELMMRFLEVHKIKSRYIPKVWIKMRMGGTTNKSIRNIWIQNMEVFNSLKKNGLSVNLISFFVNKFISRFNQFLKR